MLFGYTRPRYQVSVYLTIGPLVFYLSLQCNDWKFLSKISQEVLGPRILS